MYVINEFRIILYVLADTMLNFRSLQITQFYNTGTYPAVTEIL